jgi:hypothetical protein
MGVFLVSEMTSQLLEQLVSEFFVGEIAEAVAYFG